MHVADLGDQHSRRYGPDAGQPLDGPAAGVTAKSFGDAAVEEVFLRVEDVDQLQQGRHALGIGAGQSGLLELGTAIDPEQVGHRDEHAGLRQHGMYLSLQPGAERDQPGPVTHEFAQFPGLGRGDP